MTNSATTKNSSAANKSKPGRKPAEEKLVQSACELLTKQGPKTLSVRDIAKHAKVNHGLVHHYFGSKRDLLKDAIRKLASDHLENHKQAHLDKHMTPPPLTLSKDQDYVMAIIRCVLDGDMELATLDIKEGIAVPRTILNAINSEAGNEKTPPELKAAMAVGMAVEWSWAALGPYISDVLNVSAEQEPAITQAISVASRYFMSNPELLE